jgi:hypothetical protein
MLCFWLFLSEMALNSRGCPPPAHPIPSLQILHQPIQFPLKVLLLRQVEALSSFFHHLLLQHLRVVLGDELAPCMLECVLYDSMSHVVDLEACIRIGRTLNQTKMFLHRRNN